MNHKDRAWNELVTATEYIADCDNQIGTPIDRDGQLENLAQAKAHIDKAVIALTAARYELISR